MNFPHVKWFDSSSDDTNKNVIEKNEHICFSSDHKRKSGWRGYAEIPIDSLPVYNFLCSLKK